VTRRISLGRDAVMKLRQLLICRQPFAYCDECLAFHLDVGRARTRPQLSSSVATLVMLDVEAAAADAGKSDHWRRSVQGHRQAPSIWGAGGGQTH
jgi:hypothetical protein